MPDSKDGNSSTIKMLLDILEQDRRQVMLFVVLCFAIPSFTLSTIQISSTPFLIRIFLVISLTLFITSGILYFFYSQRIHHKRLEGLQSIIDQDASLLREELFGSKKGIWAKAGNLYLAGTISISLAFVNYILFFILFLFEDEIF